MPASSIGPSTMPRGAWWRGRGALGAAVCLLALAACGDVAGGVASGSAGTAAELVVDSILPPEEAMRRFTAGLGPAPTALDGGAPSLELLAEEFVAAATAGDSAALERLFVSRAEFAYLYYPRHPAAQEPYLLSPHLLWQMEGESRPAGLDRLRSVLPAGARVASVECDPAVDHESYLLHPGCTLRVRHGDGGSETHAWGSVLELDGVLKLVALGG